MQVLAFFYNAGIVESLFIHNEHYLIPLVYYRLRIF